MKKNIQQTSNARFALLEEKVTRLAESDHVQYRSKPIHSNGEVAEPQLDRVYGIMRELREMQNNQQSGQLLNKSYGKISKESGKLVVDLAFDVEAMQSQINHNNIKINQMFSNYEMQIANTIQATIQGYIDSF